MKQQMDVTARGGGDPERFLADEIEIKTAAGSFVITFDNEFGLLIKTPGYKAQIMRLDNNTVNVYRVGRVL